MKMCFCQNGLFHRTVSVLMQILWGVFLTSKTQSLVRERETHPKIIHILGATWHVAGPDSNPYSALFWIPHNIGKRPIHSLGSLAVPLGQMSRSHLFPRKMPKGLILVPMETKSKEIWMREWFAIICSSMSLGISIQIGFFCYYYENIKAFSRMWPRTTIKQ